MLMAHAGKDAPNETTHSPVVRRRELGALLRDLRREAGLTVEQVAESLLVSPSKISRLETGQRGASLRDVRDLCDLYEVTGEEEREHLAGLAKESRQSAWWQRFSLPYAQYVGLEAEALRISDFESGVFPGLLQVPGYARALHESGIPRPDPAVLDQRLEERSKRQEILTRSEPPPPRLQAIMDEAVLHRAVGGPETMAAQIGHVIDASQLPNITVQIVPFGAGAHPALDSTFVLLEFEDPVPGVVYVEGLVGHLYLERAQDVQRYGRVFDRLRSISLSERESLNVLRRMGAEYKKA
jgi:transcriptional regulator with XRE-family HTH domain